MLDLGLKNVPPPRTKILQAPPFVGLPAPDPLQDDDIFFHPTPRNASFCIGPCECPVDLKNCSCRALLLRNLASKMSILKGNVSRKIQIWINFGNTLFNFQKKKAEIIRGAAAPRTPCRMSIPRACNENWMHFREKNF